MNYFCSMFNSNDFSNFFSVSQKPYQKKTISQEKPWKIDKIQTKAFLPIDFIGNDMGRKAIVIITAGDV